VNHLLSRRSPLALVTLLVLVALTACNQLPKRRGAAVVEGIAPAGAIEESNPTDIVVPPVIDETGQAGFPAAALRECFQEGLVKRRYSPLSLEYVDLHVVDGIYSMGTLEEDAVLEIIVEDWDTTYLDARGAVGIRAVVRLVDASTRGLLWSGRIDQTFELGPLRNNRTTLEATYRRACEAIAPEVLAALPAHTPAP
jgi:hypothetical protein